MAKFGFLQSNILDFLFNSYCCSFYGSQLWELTSKDINEVYVTWQKAIRRIWKLHNTTHVRLLKYLSFTQKQISEQLLYRFITFLGSVIIVIINWFPLYVKMQCSLHLVILVVIMFTHLNLLILIYLIMSLLYIYIYIIGCIHFARIF